MNYRKNHEDDRDTSQPGHIRYHTVIFGISDTNNPQAVKLDSFRAKL